MSERERLIAVFCRGTPQNPDVDLGLQILAAKIWGLMEEQPNRPVKVVLFGPHTINPKMSEAKACERALRGYRGYWPKNVELWPVEDTPRLRDHVARLRTLWRDQELIVVYEETAHDQVAYHLAKHFSLDNLRPEPTRFSLGAQSWFNKKVKQPLREWLDWLVDCWPWLFGWLDRSARKTNIELARHTER